MKQLVSGPFGMRVAVTDRVAQPLASDFLQLLGSSLLKLAGTAAHGAVTDPTGADLAQLPFSALSKIVGKGKIKEPKTAASGGKDLLTASLKKGKGAATITIPLRAEENIYILPKGKGAARARKRRLAEKKGAACGSVTLKAKVYG
jgi:hypothetical protein